MAVSWCLLPTWPYPEGPLRILCLEPLSFWGSGSRQGGHLLLPPPKESLPCGSPPSFHQLHVSKVQLPLGGLSP